MPLALMSYRFLISLILNMHPTASQGATTTASDCGTGSELLSQKPTVQTWTSLITNYFGATFLRAQCWNSAEATSYWFNFVNTPNVSEAAYNLLPFLTSLRTLPNN